MQLWSNIIPVVVERKEVLDLWFDVVSKIVCQRIKKVVCSIK